MKGGISGWSICCPPENKHNDVRFVATTAARCSTGTEAGSLAGLPGAFGTAGSEDGEQNPSEGVVGSHSSSEGGLLDTRYLSQHCFSSVSDLIPI